MTLTKRKIRISDVLKDVLTNIQENFKEYNRYNNKKNIFDDIYRVDKKGAKCWHEQKNEKLEVLNNWLKGFSNEGDDN